MFALVRTSSTEKKREGITLLLLPLDAPGITIRPIKSIWGSHEFNEVIEDVRVPVANRIAEIGTDIDANDMIELLALSKVQRGGNPGSVASSVMKIECSRIRQAMSELAALILGEDATRWERRRPLYDLPEDTD